MGGSGDLRLFTPAAWWAGNAALGVLLYRGLRQRLAGEYPVFYGYLAYVLCSSLVLFRLSLASPQAYAVGFWAEEFVAVLFGVAVTWEICGAALAGCPGVRRMGRSLITVLVLVLLAKFVVDVAAQPVQLSTVELMRNLRFAQAALLLAILSLLAYYRAPLGRNVAGLLYGYTLFIAAAVTNLALRSALGFRFQSWWTALQPLAYLVTLAVWCVGLWSREENSLSNPALEQDYARFSRQTIAGMARLRARLVEGLRS
jgi:type IV secretory pathway TrbD component